MAATNNHLDYLWKSVIEDLFSDFLRFFYPKAEEIFNLKKFEFLDKELEKLYPDKEDGTRRRYADKLVKIQLKKGGEQWILIHIEVQGYDDKQFAERMFQYFYRILDRYRHPVTAIAIFTNNGKDTPDRYEVELLGTRLEYKFNTYRIIDQPEEALKAAAGNPFAQVILGAWTALMSGKMTDKELMTRHEWVFSALDKTLSSRKKMAVFAFLRYFVHFSDPKNYRIFETRLEKITGKTNVMGVREALLNHGEEIGIKKGKEIGIKEGKEIGIKKGKEIGIKKGKEIGIKKGEEIGIKKGEEIGIKKGKHLFVTNLLRATTFSVSTIASLSGVSEAFVRKVKKDLNKK